MTTTRRAHPWRRRLILAALCLLLGAVTTVGVVVAAAVRPRGKGSTRWTEAGFVAGRQRWMFSKGQRWDATSVQISFSVADERPPGRRNASTFMPFTLRHDRETYALYGAVNATMKQAPIDDFRETAFFQWLDAPWVDVPTPPEITEKIDPSVGIDYGGCAVGWPCRAAWTSFCVTKAEGNDGGLDATAIRKGWWINHNQTGIPTNILPLGFAVNTGAFAAAWWMLLVMPGAVNRWRRRRRGACLACGYDLRGLRDEAKCPECGV